MLQCTCFSDVGGVVSNAARQATRCWLDTTVMLVSVSWTFISVDVCLHPLHRIEHLRHVSLHGEVLRGEFFSSALA